MNPNPTLHALIKNLRLSGILTTLTARAEQAASGGMSPLEFFETLLQDEWDLRKDRLFERRRKTARLNPLWRLDNFDWSFNPKLQKKNLCTLATAKFIPQRENAILIGPPGTGKSHIAHAIALCALQAGYSVLAYPVFEVLELITEAAATGQRKELFAKLLKPDLLLLDDLGMKKLAPEMAEDLLEIIMRRYEKTSTLMTSNRPIEDWPKILGDTATTSALLDRLMHHSHLIPFQGKSYRLEQSTLEKKKQEI